MPEPHATEDWLKKRELGNGLLNAVGLEAMDSFYARYPTVLCVQADGTALSFKDGAVELAVANAVLEHVTPEGQAFLPARLLA
jgi:hypothetical protein